MKREDVKPDLPVIITPYRDLMFMFDVKPFITTIHDKYPKIFPVVKLTKGGMVEIQVEPKLRISVPPSNVDLWDVNDPLNQVVITETFIEMVQDFL